MKKIIVHTIEGYKFEFKNATFAIMHNIEVMQVLGDGANLIAQFNWRHVICIEIYNG